MRTCKRTPRCGTGFPRNNDGRRRRSAAEPRRNNPNCGSEAGALGQFCLADKARLTQPPRTDHSHCAGRCRATVGCRQRPESQVVPRKSDNWHGCCLSLALSASTSWHEPESIQMHRGRTGRSPSGGDRPPELNVIPTVMLRWARPSLPAEPGDSRPLRPPRSAAAKR